MTDKKLFQAQAFISKITTMEDKTLRLHIDCQEMAPDAEATLFSVRHKPGWFLFAEQELKAEDAANLPEIKLEDDPKSPSQRLRARMFVFYEQTYHKKDGFYEWYRDQLDKMGEKYLNKVQ